MLLIVTATTIASSKNSGTLVTMMPSVIDQQQPNTPEIHWLEAGVDHWQQFKNRGKTIEKIDLHIGCYYAGSQPLTLEIRETLTGTPITQLTVNAAVLPLNVQGWFTFDVPDARLVLNKVYYIVVTFEPGSEYAWSGSHNNPYPNGSSSHPDSDWDYAFKTIVDKSKSGGVNSVFSYLFEKYPSLFPLLRHLMGY